MAVAMVARVTYESTWVLGCTSAPVVPTRMVMEWLLGLAVTHVRRTATLSLVAATPTSLAVYAIRGIHNKEIQLGATL